jgi:hypothetical protein
VLHDFDQWIEAHERRDYPRTLDLALQLQRCGYQARIVRGVGGHDVYVLREIMRPDRVRSPPMAAAR